MLRESSNLTWLFCLYLANKTELFETILPNICHWTSFVVTNQLLEWKISTGAIKHWNFFSFGKFYFLSLLLRSCSMSLHSEMSGVGTRDRTFSIVVPWLYNILPRKYTCILVSSRRRGESSHPRKVSECWLSMCATEYFYFCLWCCTCAFHAFSVLYCLFHFWWFITFL